MFPIAAIAVITSQCKTIGLLSSALRRLWNVLLKLYLPLDSISLYFFLLYLFVVVGVMNDGFPVQCIIFKCKRTKSIDSNKWNRKFIFQLLLFDKICASNIYDRMPFHSVFVRSSRVKCLGENNFLNGTILKLIQFYKRHNFVHFCIFFGRFSFIYETPSVTSHLVVIFLLTNSSSWQSPIGIKQTDTNHSVFALNVNHCLFRVKWMPFVKWMFRSAMRVISH